MPCNQRPSLAGLTMELKEKSKYITTPVRVLMTAAVILIALLILQVITIEVSSLQPRSGEKPAKQTRKPTEEEKRLRRIQYSLKQVLPDGTIHLVYQPGRTLYSHWEDSAQQEVYDTNDNLLWQGIAKDSPYKYLSWTASAGGDSFLARSMKQIQMITPELSRTLEIPVRSQKETIQIWRYAPNGEFFTGYKAGGAKIGYAGATGFEDSESAVRPFGEFGSFFAWCPKDSSSPTLLWQTKSRIYQINFEKRKVELLFESPDADITAIFV